MDEDIPCEKHDTKVALDKVKRINAFTHTHTAHRSSNLFRELDCSSEINRMKILRINVAVALTYAIELHTFLAKKLLTREREKPNTQQYNTTSNIQDGIFYTFSRVMKCSKNIQCVCNLVAITWRVSPNIHTTLGMQR